MKVLGLGYVGFSSPNYAQWRQYGPDVLAMSVAPDGEDGAIRLRMDERHHRLAVHPGQNEDLAYIGWELASRRAFEDALDELAAKGIAFEMGTTAEVKDRCVQGMASMLDPSGFRHEIFWGQDVPAEPFWAPRYHRGYLGGDTGGPGHIVLVVPELTKAHSQFAIDVMGFHAFSYLVVNSPNGEAIPVEIYRCNKRTHCLIFMPVPGMKGVSHVQFETKYIDDLLRTYDLAQKKEHPIAMELGRFVVDIDVSFYLRSPSGFDVQLGWDDHSLGKDPDAQGAPAYNAAGGKTVVWGYKPLLPFLNPTIRPVNSSAPSPSASDQKDVKVPTSWG